MHIFLVGGTFYIGSWVNLGALTTNSDLKNNYHSVKINLDEKTIVDTGELKLGCFIADYVTLGIGSLIGAGTVIDSCCNIFGGGLLNNYFKPFSWHRVGPNLPEKYEIDKSINTFSLMMQRRGMVLDEEIERKMRNLYE